jgi:RNA polymerase sigma-70 factor (ECF subfamily)
MTEGKAIATDRLDDLADAPVVNSALLTVYVEVETELRRFVLGVTRDPNATDDVMQATFVKAVEAGDGVRLESGKAWLFRVAFHEALELRRRSASRERGRLRLAELGRALPPGPDAAVIQVETAARVRQALARLPEEQRRVIVARVDEDKTFAEIAREANLPLGTVLTRMRRGLEKLRRILPGDTE